MKKKIFLPMMAATLLFGMGLVACNKPAESTKQPTTSSVVPAKPKINVSAAGDKKTLEIDEEVQLTADQNDVTWKSSDEKVATVDGSGKVKAIASGSVTITASKEGYQNGTISITVNKPAALATLHMEDADHYSADGWWASSSYGPGATPIYERTSGNASDGKCIAYMDNGDKETLTFTSDKALKAELVVMMASRTAVEDLTAVMDVKLNDAAINPVEKAFEGGSSSDFAEVSFGQVDIKSGDNVLLFEFKASSPYMDDVMLYSKEKATVAVKAAPAKETITITNEDLSVEEGKTLQLAGAPAGASYVSSDETKATVDQNGLVTGVAVGSASITVTKAGMYSARVTITVKERVISGQFVTEFEAGEQEGAQITFRDASGSRRVTDAFPKDEVLTVPVNAPAAGKYTMIFVARVARNAEFDGNLASAFEIKMNNAAVTTSATLNGTSWANYEIADVNLNNGANTLTLKALTENNPVNFDSIKFVPKNA